MLKQKTIVNICKNFVLLTIFTTCFSQQSWSLQCERKTSGHDGFASQSAFESWFPKTRNFSNETFTRVGNGSKSIIFTERLKSSKGRATSVSWRLLPSGKMKAWLDHSQPYVKKPGNVFYNCNMKPQEVLDVLEKKKAEKLKTPKTVKKTKQQKCFGGDLTSCDEKMLCNRATSIQWVNGETAHSWEEEARWRPFVTEAIRRGLGCGVTEIEENGIPASVTAPSRNEENKVARAEEKCTSLGFTAGTEKHGDCVMKLLDD